MGLKVADSKSGRYSGSELPAIPVAAAVLSFCIFPTKVVIEQTLLFVVLSEPGGTPVNTLRLSDLTPGSTAIVSAICGASRIASRLMEMGFVPGAVVEVLRRAPFGGPVQYRIHGVSISMRNAEASCVSVESVPSEQRVGVRSSRRLELAVQ